MMKNIAVATYEIFKHLQNLKYSVKTEGIVYKGVLTPFLRNPHPPFTQTFSLFKIFVFFVKLW